MNKAISWADALIMTGACAVSSAVAAALGVELFDAIAIWLFGAGTTLTIMALVDRRIRINNGAHDLYSDFDYPEFPVDKANYRRRDDHLR